jgi:hypothetical protein
MKEYNWITELVEQYPASAHHKFIEEVIEYIHQERQKARHDWLREEIVKLEKIKSGIEKFDYDSDERGKCEILQIIIDRYLSELDQPNK